MPIKYSSSKMLFSQLIVLILLAISHFCCADLIEIDNLLGDLRDAANQIKQQIQMANQGGDSKLIKELGELGKQIAKKINQKSNENLSKIGPIKLHNWGGTFQFATQNIQYPRTVEEVKQIVRRSIKLRVLGCRHSFSKIADSPDTILSTLGMNSILALNTSIPSVTVQSGVTYTDLCPFLHAIGFALPNLAALGEISVGGAIGTGVHGSGLDHKALASQMLSMELVMANGNVATFRKDDPEWNALAVGFGAFGVVTKIEFKLVPTFNVATYVFMNMPLDNLFDNFNEIMSIGYTVQLFSSMANSNTMDQIWVLVRPDQDTSNVANLTELFGAIRAPGQVTPIAVLPTTYLIDQGVEQPWYEGLTDYKFGLSGADGNEIQTEWIVPYENGVPAMKALANLNAELAPLIYVWFIRTIKADEFWMSQCSGGTAHLAIHFTWLPNMTAVLEMMPKINNILVPFNARPHWGKMFTMTPEQFLPTYPNLNKFKQLAKQFDPFRKFRNEFLEKNIFFNFNK